MMPLIEYIRKSAGTKEPVAAGANPPRGKRKGVLVAYVDDCDPHHYLVGWSLCNKTDKFDREQGLTIAMARAITWSVRGKYTDEKKPLDIPVTVQKHLKDFLARCDRYFKGKTSPFKA